MRRPFVPWVDVLCLCLIAIVPTGCDKAPVGDGQPASKASTTAPAARGHAVLTVAEGKRLIAKGVVKMPIVQKALTDGIVIVCRGTTNTYIAEELLGQAIEPGKFVLGHVLPEKGGRPMPKPQRLAEVILVKGRYRPEMTFDEALKKLRPGDVVFKGGNALDYAHQKAAVWIGSPTGGTTAKILPAIESAGARLIVPIGLEKNIAGRLADNVARTNQSVATAPALPHMRFLPGTIITELEALQILAGVDAYQASSGGVGGAEGAAWLVWTGSAEAVEKARQIVADVQGEKPFLAPASASQPGPG